MSEKEEKKVEIRTEVEESARRGEYSNFVRIQHTAMDFRLDFARAIADENLVSVHSRIFMSPIHAKMFLKAMEDNIKKYENQFGTIQIVPASAIALNPDGSKFMH